MRKKLFIYTTLIMFMFSFTAYGQDPSYFSSTLTLNDTEYSAGDTLTAEVTTTSQLNGYNFDEYFAVVLPSGDFYCLDYNDNFVGPNEIAVNSMGNPTMASYTRPITTLVIPDTSIVPAGQYTFWVIETYPGTSPADTSNWMMYDSKTITVLGQDGTVPTTAEPNDNIFTPPTDSISVENNLVYINNPDRDYQAGDVIIGSQDSPYIIKVTGVYPESGRVGLSYGQATLEDVVKQGTLSFNSTPNWSQATLTNKNAMLESGTSPALPDFSIQSDGTIVFGSFSLFSLSVSNGVVDWTNSTVFGEPASSAMRTSFQTESLPERTGTIEARVVSASFKFTPSVNGSMDFTLLNGLEKLDSTISGSVTFNIQVELSISEEISFESSKSILPTISLPFVVPVGAVPVYMAVNLDLDAGFSVSGKVSGTITAGFNSSYNVSADISYLDDHNPSTDDWTIEKTDTYNFSPNVNVTVGGELSAEVYFAPKVTLEIYKTAGPYIYLQPYLLNEMTAQTSLGGSTYNYTLWGGVKGGAGVNVTILSQELYDKNWDLFDYKEKLYETTITSQAPYTVASPSGGTFSTPQTVTLTAYTDSSMSSQDYTATIYYSTDGVNANTYTGPISISSTTTLYFYAVDSDGYSEADDTGIKSQTYTFADTSGDISDTWTSTGQTTLTTTTSFGGQDISDTQTQNGTGTVTITQSGSNIIMSYSSGAYYTGTISGNTITVSGTMAEATPGVTYSENLYTATGTINGNTITMTGSGRAVYTISQGGITVTYTIATSVTETITR